MGTQDEHPGEDTRVVGWSISDGTSAAGPAARAARKTTTSKRKSTSSGKTTKQDAKKPKTPAKPKTTKAAKDDDKPTPKRKTSKTAKDGEKPKSTAKPKTAKSTTKPKTTKKEASSTSKRRPRRKRDLGDLISELLERRAAGEKGTEAIVEAILEHLTKNLGLSSGAAEVVVGAILDKLVKSKKEKARAETGEAAAPETGELDLSGFSQQTRGGPVVDITTSEPAEELEELAQQAGLDAATLASSVRQVLKMLGEAAE